MLKKAYDGFAEQNVWLARELHGVLPDLHDALFHRDVYAVQVEWTVAVPVCVVGRAP